MDENITSLEANPPVTKEQKQFLDALKNLPPSGIALRGDPLKRAEELQNGLNEPQVNYILFAPEMRPESWGNEAQRLQDELTSAMDMAMVYTDPWYETGAFSNIPDSDFTTFSDYFERHPDAKPAITWFTESEKEQFKKVKTTGRSWVNYEHHHSTGDVKSFGPINSDNIQPTLILDIEEITKAEEAVMQEGAVKDVSLLRGKRKEFRAQLAKIAARKLVTKLAAK